MIDLKHYSNEYLKIVKICFLFLQKKFFPLYSKNFLLLKFEIFTIFTEFSLY